jgi:hypothetical protein
MGVLQPCLAFVLFAAAAAPTDWPQLRGPNRDGISTETGLLPAWSAGGPPVAWKISGTSTITSQFDVERFAASR